MAGRELRPEGFPSTRGRWSHWSFSIALRKRSAMRVAEEISSRVTPRISRSRLRLSPKVPLSIVLERSNSPSEYRRQAQECQSYASRAGKSFSTKIDKSIWAPQNAGMRFLFCWFVWSPTKGHRLNRLRKNSQFCHSERSEESLFDCKYKKTKEREILRFAQNDKINTFSAACEACATYWRRGFTIEQHCL